MHSRRSRSRLSPGLLLLYVVATSGHASAQCATRWLPGPGLAGTNDDDVRCSTTWDPDGAGPAQPILVIAGTFTIAGTALANSIAAFDPGTGAWTTLGTGMNDHVYAVATLANGDLVAGGRFTSAGGVSADRIARWNGASWSALGSGIAGSSAQVSVLAALPNGDLVVGGWFTSAGGVSVSNIARWDGTTWSAVGAGTNGPVSALTTLPNGDLVAGGGFTTAGYAGANNLASWDGTSWSPLGSGTNTVVSALTTLPNGNLVACGQFTTAGGTNASHIARWDGTSWFALGSGLNGDGYALLTLPNGDLVVGGWFTAAGGVSANAVARWDGTSWSPLGSGLSSLAYTVTMLPNGDLVAGGDFFTAGGVFVSNVARWNGTSWSALGSAIGPTHGWLAALTTMPNGDLVVGGTFPAAGGVIANNIARWSGTSWSALGSGCTGSASPYHAPTVAALAVLPNGDLVAGGRFTTAGSVSANAIARWDGTNWLPLGAGMSWPGAFLPPAIVRALVVLPNGDLVAGGEFTTAGGVPANYVARWDGTTWSALGPGTGHSVHALAVMPNGDLVAGGSFSWVGGTSMNGVARWNGTSWSGLGSGMLPYVAALAVLPNGDLAAAGQFTWAGSGSANSVARWNGTDWSPLGTGISLPGTWPTLNIAHVGALAVLPNGDLVAGGRFATAGGVSASNMARWNGTSWSAVGSGTNGDVHAFTMLRNGDLVAGGGFTVVDGAVSASMAQLTTTCPASAAGHGAGCTGTGGANVLSATALPWTGSTFRSVATGMPSPALAVVVLGSATASIPMPSILPQGVPGCTLLVTPDLLELHVPAAGIVQTALVIPNDLALAGAVLHQQVAAIELGGTGAITALTGTNALTLTIGSF